MRFTLAITALCLALSAAAPAAAESDLVVLSRTDRAAVVIKVELREGAELADEFPAKLVIRTIPESHLDETIDLGGRVSELLSGVTIEVPEKRTQVIDAELEIGVCDATGTCKPRHVAFQAVVARRPERQFTELTLRAVRPLRDPALAERVRAKAAAEAALGAWIADDLPAALAAAAERGVPVLMVFSTSWCPPCGRLRDEVVLDPERHGQLGDVVLARFDADLATSWEAKTRYRVTGYPTSVLCSPEGELLWRHVGYETAEDYVARVAQATGAAPPSLEALQAAAEESGDPAALLAVADRHRARGDAAAAAEWLARVPAGVEVDAALRARVAAFVALHDEDPAAGADALEQLLLDQAVTPAVPLIEQQWWWVELAGLYDDAGDAEHAALARERATAAAEQLLSGNPEEQAAIEAWEVIALAAGAGGEDGAARAAWSEVADRLLAPFGGELPEGEAIRRSRGSLLTLIPALARAGRGEEARQVADRAVDAFPKEDTFYLLRARAVHRLDGASEAALADAATACRLARGDSRLRAADAWTAMLIEAERPDEARAALHEVLDPLELPADPDIRTHRYAAILQQRLAELEPPPAEEPEIAPEAP